MLNEYFTSQLQSFIMSEGIKAIVLGASGAVGTHVAGLLLRDKVPI
jgi:hypothetical protein